MVKFFGIVSCLCCFLLFNPFHVFAQFNKNIPSRTDASDDASPITYDKQGRPIKNANKQDSLQKRDRYADSITIFYRFYDSTRTRTFDSALNDFSTRFPKGYTFENLGNLGSAARPLLFSPILHAGFDAGFHQFDVYKYTIENTKFFQTTRPYSELGYLLASKSEQLIDFVHTQNKGSNFNFSIEYRFINSPGLYRTQNASHNNFRFTTHYQTKNKVYECFFIFLSNKHASSENGGLVDKSKLDSLALNNPYELNTRLGSPTLFNRNPFNTTVNTGNIYKENTFLFRHQYDFGQKDSLVTDSIVYHYFYPRFRLQHTLQYSTNEYLFLDNATDSAAYLDYFNYSVTPPPDTITFKDRWKRVSNELSIISFPDKNNQSQYAKLGAIVNNWQLNTSSYVSSSFSNLAAIGEYRNRTRNKKWDMIANGQLYLLGSNAGDYQAYISLKRELSKRIGTLQIGFQNVNRTPSFIYSSFTAFPNSPHPTFAKENSTHLFGVYNNPLAAVTLAADYYLVNNYAYSDSFFSVKQNSSLFNLLHIYGMKTINLSKHWRYYAELHLQQATGNAPINVPQIISRHRFAFEGDFYTNLSVSTGVEMSYASNYKSPNYSPITGQFFYQEGFTLKNRPDVNLFFHFRIKSFKAYARLENLNTIEFKNGITFTHYNYKLADYPGIGQWIRVGIWWSFVN